MRLPRCLAILLELLSEHEELIPALPTILFFRHPLFSFPPHLFTGILLRTIDLRL